MVGEEHQPWPEVNYFNSVLLTFSESERPFGRAEQDDSSILGLKQSARRRSWCLLGAAVGVLHQCKQGVMSRISTETQLYPFKPMLTRIIHRPPILGLIMGC